MRAFSIHRAVSGSMLLLGARIIGAGVALATQALLARMLSPDNLGLFFFATSVAAIAGTVASFGYPGIAVRFMARYSDRGQSHMLRGFISCARRDTAWASGAAAVIVVLMALFSRSGGEESRIVVAAAAMAIPAIAFLRVNGAIAAASGAFNLSFFPDTFYRPVTLLLVLGAYYSVVGTLSVISVVVLATFIHCAVAAAQVSRLPSYLPANLGHVACDRRLTRHWRAVGRPLVILTIVSSLFSDLTLAVLGTILPKAELAVFGVCLKLAFMVGFAIQLLHEFAAPEISLRYIRVEIHVIKRTIALTNLVLVVMTFTATVATGLLGHYILAIFGPDFVVGYYALLILVAAQIIRAAVGPSITLLIAAKLQNLVAGIVGAAIAMLVILNFVLVPHFGILGAAVAVALTTTLWTLTTAVIAWWKIGIRTDLFDSIHFLTVHGHGSIPLPVSRAGR